MSDKNKNKAELLNRKVTGLFYFAPLKGVVSPLVCFVFWAIKIFSLLSLMSWIEFLYHRRGKDVPNGLTELWVIFLLSSEIVCLQFLGVYENLIIWFGIYGLYDILISASWDLIINPLSNKVTKGKYYIEVENPIRWLVLTIINIGQAIFCFAIIFLVFGNQFNPTIRDSITAIYQSILTFTTLGYGDIKPACNFGKLIVIFELIFFLIFITLKLPIVLSVFSVKSKE